MNKKHTSAPIIGFVRYSQKIFFGDGIKDIFEPHYFEYRFKIFKEVTLKSFQHQTNPNFVLLLLHSESMPLEYQRRFMELENSNSFLENLFIKDNQEGFNDAIHNSINYVSFSDNCAVTFRIDNDDAVPNDFIEQLSWYLRRDFVGYIISMPTVYIVKRISSEQYKLQEVFYPANSIGLANITGKENYETIMDLGQHHLINDHEKLILLPKLDHGSLQTINGENAVNTIDDTKAMTYDRDHLEKFLLEKKIEKINLDCLLVFRDEKESDFYKILRLLIPPIFYKLENKIRYLLKY